MSVSFGCLQVCALYFTYCMILVWPFQEILAVLLVSRRLAPTRLITPEACVASSFSSICTWAPCIAPRSCRSRAIRGNPCTICRYLTYRALSREIQIHLNWCACDAEKRCFFVKSGSRKHCVLVLLSDKVGPNRLNTRCRISRSFLQSVADLLHKQMSSAYIIQLMTFVRKENLLMAVNEKTVFVLSSPFIELRQLNCT